MSINHEYKRGVILSESVIKNYIHDVSYGLQENLIIFEMVQASVTEVKLLSKSNRKSR